MKFDEFLEKVKDVYEENNKSYENKLRYGQTLMNVLYDVWKEKYNEICNTNLDCFYNDNTVKLTIGKLQEDWELKNSSL